MKRVDVFGLMIHKALITLIASDRMVTIGSRLRDIRCVDVEN